MAQSFKSIVVEAGGYENVAFLEKDARNYVDKARRLRLGEGDAAAIQKYFQKMQAENDGFFFSLDLDEEGWLNNVFWADPRSRAAYKDFGDVVTFDTTYLTNKYDMPFAPFVGVNHHAWHDMLDKYGIVDNQWLNGLYEEIYRWVSCFVKITFWAGMSTTQRSESMNAFFYGYVNSKTTLKQFVEKYEKAMESKIEKEWQADARCFSQRMPCRTNFAMEKQVEEVYTISKFQEFQQQLMNKMYCEVFSCGGSEYEVVENNGKSKEKTFQVIFEMDDGEIRCACAMFECRGIVCGHAIAVMIRTLVTFLPEKYIIRRWRKDVRRCYSRVKVGYDVRSSSIEHQRYKEECAAFYDVADVASKHEDVTVVGGSGSCTEIIQDPVVSCRKGRPHSQRK
ncbi:protein FAR1-RELATED SEQUENCE 5-like [Citrus clementina]|uniref:protein FAR1-RELATED SEQUENCE 5-like n=1 Tax=Citrus clementina TaxID=85681 RepID=UPI000CED4102|nr:protein FAR1-RELATED SEQUENCE 5-like [Citrus x clementina]